MNYQKLEEIARQIRAGKLEGSAATAALNDWSVADGVAADIVHFLFHYIADEDIRVRDKDYASHQEDQLDKLLEKLSRATAIHQSP